MSKDYRFHLQSGQGKRKSTCPHCGRQRCFTRYVDEMGEIAFPEYVGRCDHENSCKYHYSVEEYFKNNPRPDKAEHNYVPVIVKPSKTSYIYPYVFEKTLSHYETNPLYRYFCSRFGTDEADRIFALYKIGTSKKWNGAVIFWQIDSEGKVRDGKVMGYDPKSGRRIKEPISQVTWVHSELRLADYQLKQCLFGAHLLTEFPSVSVMIVESEKTAMIAAHFLPDYLWLATGGKNGCFNSEAFQVLSGRDVTMVPDLGATAAWREKAHLMGGICKSLVVSDLLEKMASDEQREAGLDIADFLLMEETPQSILAKMIERNPELQRLIDDLDLVLVE